MSTKNPKLLYVINHMDWFWSHRLPLAEGARDKGYDVCVAASGAGGNEKLSQAGFTGLELGAADNPVRFWLGLHKLLKAEKPDILHVITIKYAFLCGLVALLHPNIRKVYTIAGLGYLFSGEGLKPGILRAILSPFFKLVFRDKRSKIIFQNPDDMAIFISRGFAREDQCSLIRGSGVDTQQFTPAQAEDNTKTPLVVMPTRLVHDKGVAVFIEAARILKSQGVEAHFQIAGGVTRHNPLAISEEEIKAMTADGAAKWLGKVDDMPALLRAACIIAYPSYYREGIPKVLLEAAACARAIITTDHPGCREVVDHGRNGLLVPVKDADALAAAMAELLGDPVKRAAMGKLSREKAEKEFDVRLIVQQTLTVYESN